MKLGYDHEKKLETTMNQIKSWICSRPFTAVVLTAVFGITATAAAMDDRFIPYAGVLFCIGVLVMVFSMWRFTGIMLAIVLAISGITETKAQEQPPVAEAPIGVAVVVVVVGGVCVYLLVKTCKRLFPKTPAPETNSPPNIIGRPDDTAGSWTYGATYCYDLQSEQLPEVTMELSGVIEEGEHGPFLRLHASRQMYEPLQDFDSFQQDLQRHGITVGPIGTMNFGRNGRPAYEDETPIRFTESDGKYIATVNSEAGTNVIMKVQRSFDLRTWSDFGFVSGSIGQRFRLIDTTTSRAAFYRIQR